jgi:hypothetical protein
MCTPLACSDYYETSASPHTFSRRRAYPTNPNGFQAKGTARDDSRVHCEPIDQRGIQLCPATSSRVRRSPSSQPPHRHRKPATESTSHYGRLCVAPRPISARFEPVPPYGALPLVPLVYHLISLVGPGLSGSAKPSRLCQRCLPSSPASPESDCAQLLPSCCGSSTRRSCTSFGSQRLTAHCDFMAQDEDLDVFGRGAASE